jgi:ribosome-associated toxin RatA of RatAB toxin-antitoxin module
VQSRALAGLAGALLLCTVQPAPAADDVAVQVERQGDSIEVKARASVAAAQTLVWQVLTDYDGLARFIPGISRSVVRDRQGNRMVVDQAGEARFLVFAFPIEVRLEITEGAPDWIVSRAVSGNFKRMTGRYDLRADAARGVCRLQYEGQLEPDFALPPVVGLAAMRGMIEAQFTAMVAEIERRAAEQK